MANSSSVRECTPAALQELAVLLKTIREKKGLTIRGMERVFPALKRNVISQLEMGHGTGRPGQNTFNFWRIEQLAEAYEIPQPFLEELLAGQLTAKDILSLREKTQEQADNQLQNQLQKIAQTLSFTSVYDLAKKSGFDIERIAEIIAGDAIKSTEKTKILAFIEFSKMTLVSALPSREDKDKLSGCNNQINIMKLGDLIKEEAERRGMTIDQLAKAMKFITPGNLKKLVEGRFEGNIPNQLNLLYRHLHDPRTGELFNSEAELEMFLIDPTWTPKNCNSANGFCNNHSH